MVAVAGGPSARGPRERRGRPTGLQTDQIVPRLPVSALSVAARAAVRCRGLASLPVGAPPCFRRLGPGGGSLSACAAHRRRICRLRARNDASLGVLSTGSWAGSGRAGAPPAAPCRRRRRVRRRRSSARPLAVRPRRRLHVLTVFLTGFAPKPSTRTPTAARTTPRGRRQRTTQRRDGRGGRREQLQRGRGERGTRVGLCGTARTPGWTAVPGSAGRGPPPTMTTLRPFVAEDLFRVNNMYGGGGGDGGGGCALGRACTRR